MMPFAQDLSIVIDGIAVDPGMQSDDPLVRAVLISLFTWRRALPDDPLPSDDRMGWWGDTYAPQIGDRIGSRLWLLAREKLTAQTVERARGYAREALQWLIDDEVAVRVDVAAERLGLTTLALRCTVYRADGATVALRFSDVWRQLNAA